MERRSFLTAAGLGLAASFGPTLREVMAMAAETPDAWAAGFAAARAEHAWLAGFEGVSADLPPSTLTVEGRFPAALHGVLYRNGPARQQIGGLCYHHLFDGDGMIQRYDIDARGTRTQVAHRGVFARTDKFVADTAAGRPVRGTFATRMPGMEPVDSPDAINVANTSVVMHGNELLALWEGGSATRLDPDSLQTLGFKTWRADYAGMPFSAHPKVEADGTLWNFGVSSAAGLLTVYCVGADGALKRVQSVRVPWMAMVHDFAVTGRHLVFLLPSFIYDVERARNGASFLDAHVWRPELGMRALVLDKNDAERMRWFELPAGFVFHVGNAWASKDGQRIHLDYVRSDDAAIVTTALRELMRGHIVHPAAPAPADAIDARPALGSHPADRDTLCGRVSEDRHAPHRIAPSRAVLRGERRVAAVGGQPDRLRYADAVRHGDRPGAALPLSAARAGGGAPVRAGQAERAGGRGLAAGHGVRCGCAPHAADGIRCRQRVGGAGGRGGARRRGATGLSRAVPPARGGVTGRGGRPDTGAP